MRLFLVYITAFLQCLLLVHSSELKTENIDNIYIQQLGNDTNATTAAPTVAPNNSTNVTTAAPSSVTPHNNTNTTTPAPSAAPSSAGNHTNVTTSAPTLAPNVTTSAPTSSPTKQYIAPTTEAPAPAPAPTPAKKKKSFIRKFFDFIGWMLLIGISLMAIAACMTHRTQIYFFLLGLMHTIREACETFTFRMSLVCAGIGRTVQSWRIGDRIYDLWGRIRGLGGGNRGNRSNFANDEDGSMLQGLLLRENA